MAHRWLYLPSIIFRLLDEALSTPVVELSYLEEVMEGGTDLRPYIDAYGMIVVADQHASRTQKRPPCGEVTDDRVIIMSAVDVSYVGPYSAVAY